MSLLSRLAALSLARRFRLAAALVAGLGLACAAVVWATAPEIPANSVSFDRTKAEERQLEMIGGKFAVEAARLSRWFDGLWVGRDLAVTLAVSTLAVTLLLLWLARVAAIDPIDDDPP
jgi:hypothetical protein